MINLNLNRDSKVRAASSHQQRADITKINSSEAEFLFKPNTRYKLNKVEPSKTDPSVLIYKITEL